MSCDIHIEEGNGLFLLFLHGKLHTRVHRIEAFSEILRRVAALLARAAQAAAARERGRPNHTPDIIHVYKDVARYGIKTLPSNDNGNVHGVCHPYLRHKHHETESNGAAILGGMVAVVIDKV